MKPEYSTKTVYALISLDANNPSPASGNSREFFTDMYFFAKGSLSRGWSPKEVFVGSE